MRIFQCEVEKEKQSDSIHLEKQMTIDFIYFFEYCGWKKSERQSTAENINY